MLLSGLRLSSDLLGASLPQMIEASLRQDKAVASLAKQIAGWVPAAGHQVPGALARARLRMQMRGGLFAGPIYLLRLALSPTEDDWADEEASHGGRLLEIVRRPFRLSQKYGKDQKQ
jgi:hypothetical protein